MILTKPIETRIITIKIARICQYIFFVLTAILAVLYTASIAVLLASQRYEESLNGVRLLATTLWYFWAGSLVAFIVLYAYVKTHPPKEVTLHQL